MYRSTVERVEHTRMTEAHGHGHSHDNDHGHGHGHGCRILVWRSFSAIIPILRWSVAWPFCCAKWALLFAHTGPSVGPALGYWVKEVWDCVTVHFPLGYIAKINTPWPWGRIGAAIVRASVACFVPDSADDDLPLLVFWNKQTFHYL